MLQLTQKEYKKIMEGLDRVAFNSDSSNLTAYRQKVVDCLFEVFGYTNLFWLLDDEGRLMDPIFTNIEDKSMYEYFETYHTHDVLAPGNIPTGVPTAPILKNKDVMPYNQFKKTEYALHYFDRFGYIDEMGIYIYDKSELVGVIGLVRKKEEGHFSEVDRNCIQFLIKSIEGAFNAAAMISQEQREPILEARLTSREKEIVKLVRQGLLNKEIGEALSISVNTVKKHLQNVFQKMGVENRTELGYLLSRINL
ncbi:transcriptional regulator [Bacillus sp. OxB-1]|uniref:response regulator transcription factor n=1 Tax=Bacillus sp. (strain OxB-1) TaxID=98228 RepID=UPI0005820CBC|nr:response regulator transcription factor [Bacillus sp. OxB-1]BAQ09240.1 transcriptional regulator [Bacillus sp. OxB-1]